MQDIGNGHLKEMVEMVSGTIYDDNAINYTPSGTIAVSLKKENGKIVFSVKDSGIGITEEDKKKLFTEGGHGKDSQKVNVHSTALDSMTKRQLRTLHRKANYRSSRWHHHRLFRRHQQGLNLPCRISCVTIVAQTIPNKYLLLTKEWYTILEQTASARLCREVEEVSYLQQPSDDWPFDRSNLCMCHMHRVWTPRKGGAISLQISVQLECEFT